jgi:hypothetical protein
MNTERELSDAELESAAGGFLGLFLAAMEVAVRTPGGPLAEGCSRTSYSDSPKVEIHCKQ